MPKISQKIDKLTKSIENRFSGDSFATAVFELKPEELKSLNKKWKFDWGREFLIGNKCLLIRIRHYA
jgi:hypothetical protein